MKIKSDLGYLIEMVEEGVIEYTTSHFFDNEDEISHQYEEFITDIMKFYDRHPSTRFRVFGNEGYGIKNGKVSEKVRRQLFDLFEDPQTARWALYGKSDIATNFIKTLAQFTDAGDKIQFFKTRDEAYNWIKNEKDK